jgi:hypothetical protein
MVEGGLLVAVSTRRGFAGIALREIGAFMASRLR